MPLSTALSGFKTQLASAFDNFPGGTGISSTELNELKATSAATADALGNAIYLFVLQALIVAPSGGGPCTIS